MPDLVIIDAVDVLTVLTPRFIPRPVAPPLVIEDDDDDVDGIRPLASSPDTTLPLAYPRVDLDAAVAAA